MAPPSPEDACIDQFGSVPGFELCAATDESCTFSATKNATLSCDAVCAAHGGSCLGAYNNSSAEPCVSLGLVTCNASDHIDDICVCAPTGVGDPPDPPPVWTGDFETGDLSQWDSTQRVSADRLQVVESPSRQGSYALRVEVRQGDDPIDASGDRAELVRADGSSQGTEFYYGWSTLWPADYAFAAYWQVFTQWHHPGNNGAPPLRFVMGCSASDCGQPLPDTMFFIVDGTNIWQMAPIVPGEWHDFVLHVKWSSDASVGFVELWYDGELVVPKRYVRTLFDPGDSNYLKQGLYRHEAISQTQIVFHDRMVQATTYEGAAP